MKKVILTLATATFFFSSCKKDENNGIVYGSVTDIDGNVYQTVKIGNQEWMAENLKVTHYRNGDAIPNLTDGNDWNDAGDNNIGAYCSYENNQTNATTYGYLYNWYAATDSRNIAPDGWHVPTKAEWEQLESFLMDGNVDNGGIKLKEEGTAHWQANSSTQGTNSTGFTALPGGERVNFAGAAFSDLGKYGYWWTTTSFGTTTATGVSLLYHNSGIGYTGVSTRRGYSIRCVKD